jgi:2-methylisocitrate lyase-like PEP mutase family enzyme
MIEDQVSPKRCGHTRGKQVVERTEALARIRAAVDAKQECAGEILILARTDARATDGLEEALYRARAFEELGADIVFVEAPLDEFELERVAKSVQVPALANMLEQGKTPVLPPQKLEALGFKIAAYPITLLNACIGAMQRALGALKRGEAPEHLLSFEALKDVVGFNAYYAEESRYGTRSSAD